MLADLDSRGTGNLDSRTVTICSGLDFVNISYNNFVAADEKIAKVLVTTDVKNDFFYFFYYCHVILLFNVKIF